MKKILAVDLDDVLAETLDAVLAFHDYDFLGTPMTREDISNYHLHKIQDKSFTKEQEFYIFNEFLNSPAHKEIDPVQGAKQQLETLKQNGWDIHIVTARRSEYKENTHKRIDIHFPGIFSSICFAEHYSDLAKPKSEICKDLGALCMVEDNLDYALECANNNIKTYLIDKPRNKSYTPNTHHNIIKVNARKDINL